MLVNPTAARSILLKAIVTLPDFETMARFGWWVSRRATCFSTNAELEPRADLAIPPLFTNDWCWHRVFSYCFHLISQLLLPLWAFSSLACCNSHFSDHMHMDCYLWMPFFRDFKHFSVRSRCRNLIRAMDRWELPASRHGRGLRPLRGVGFP